MPDLLRRAQSLAEKNFMDIITDLAPDAIEQISKITGRRSKAETGQAAGEPGQTGT